MKNYSRIAMPIAFLAMHEEKGVEGTQNLQEVWEEIWQDGTLVMKEGSDRILYSQEIMELLPKALKSELWNLIARTARAMRTVCTKLGGTINSQV